MALIITKEYIQHNNGHTIYAARVSQAAHRDPSIKMNLLYILTSAACETEILTSVPLLVSHNCELSCPTI